MKNKDEIVIWDSSYEKSDRTITKKISGTIVLDKTVNSPKKKRRSRRNRNKTMKIGQQSLQKGR